MEKRSQRYTPRVLPGALVLIGFTSVIAQIVLMRELIVVFQGNEISLGFLLACWLFWTAVGSGVLGRWIRRFHSPLKTVAWLEVGVAVILPVTILAVRAARILFNATPGEILGPGPAFLTSFVVLSAFCLVSGCLFAAGSRLYRLEHGTTTARAGGLVYLLEAAGACLGGILAGLILIKYMSAPEIVLVLSLLNILAAVFLTFRRITRRAGIVWLSVGLAAISLSPLAGRALDSFSLGYLWRGFELVESQNSIYGNITLTATENTKSVFVNGLIYLTVPDVRAAEENVHYALLQHPSPQRLLMIGGGLNGSLNHALQHPSLERLDYVELDPTLLQLARDHLGENVFFPESDPRVEIHSVDGRLWVKRANVTYDVVVVNLPDPQTAQLNRLYTVEFFRDVVQKLSPGGVLSFQVTGSENYISDGLAGLLRCLKKTLAQVFPEIIVFPGSTIHFFAASEKGSLTADPDLLLERLRDREISASYLREYYIPFRLAPDRLLDLESSIKPRPYTLVNKDITPVAYYFNAVLWSTHFNRVYADFLRWMAGLNFRYLAMIFAGFLLVVVITVLSWRRGPGRLHTGAGMCAASLGFTIIGLEVLLLLAFQAIHGYVYRHLAVLIAGFMAGMALGSYLSLRQRSEARNESPSGRDGFILLIIQSAAVVCPVLLVWFFAVSARVANPAGLFVLSNLCFPVLAFLLGGLGGYQFPVASRVYYRGKRAPGSGPGAVYALDLAGACLGAALVSGYFLPVFGFLKTAILLAVVNLAPLVVVAFSLTGRRAIEKG